MIYLTTGGNGAGKTLITLKDVRDQQVRESRPVYFHGFEALEPLLDWGWKPFDPKKWQDLPDGSICVMDECQNEFPAKLTGELPDYINAVAQFRRKRGFDFWMITPHPRLIHINIRQLIESPSWHRHFKRTMGADMVSELRFNFANLKCEQPGAGKSGEVSMRAFPKEVYSWYRSASLHTGKKKLPKQVWYVAAAAVVVPALLFAAYKNVTGTVLKDVKETEQKTTVAAPVSGSVPVYTGQGLNGKLTVTEYLQARTPRVPDFPHTAPAYDEVTKPVTAPYPAACMYSHQRKTCMCYSQQGTVLATSGETCMQIVKNGFFIDWGDGRGRHDEAQPRVIGADAVQVDQRAQPAARQVKQVGQLGAGVQVPDGWSEGLAARNAQVRSSFSQ